VPSCLATPSATQRRCFVVRARCSPCKGFAGPSHHCSCISSLSSPTSWCGLNPLVLQFLVRRQRARESHRTRHPHHQDRRSSNASSLVGLSVFPDECQSLFRVSDELSSRKSQRMILIRQPAGQMPVACHREGFQNGSPGPVPPSPQTSLVDGDRRCETGESPRVLSCRATETASMETLSTALQVGPDTCILANTLGRRFLPVPHGSLDVPPHTRGVSDADCFHCCGLARLTVAAKYVHLCPTAAPWHSFCTSRYMRQQKTGDSLQAH
jgi:hypothetical protein